MSNYGIKIGAFNLQRRKIVEKKKDTSVFLFWVLLCSLVYGGVFVSLPLYEFSDRNNYLRYASHSWDIFEMYRANGLLVVLANEPLWLLLNAALAKIFAPETVLRIIIFFPATWVAWTILRHNSPPFIWLLLFLLLPQTVVHHLCMLRQGLAIAIFLAGWFSPRRYIRLLLMAVTPFIHASFVFVLAIYFLSFLLRKLKVAADVRTLTYCSFALGFSLLLAWLASMVGARQAEYYTFSAADISGFGFVFWLVILFVMFLQGKRYLYTYSFEVGGLFFYLVSYFFIPVSARIFESMLLLILIAGLHLTGWRCTIFLVSITSYCILQYALKIHQPWLGFGV